MKLSFLGRFSRTENENLRLRKALIYVRDWVNESSEWYEYHGTEDCDHCAIVQTIDAALEPKVN